MLTADAVLQFIGWLYIGCAALAILLTVIFAKGGRRKGLLVLVVLILFSWWPVTSMLKAQRQAEAQAAKMKLVYERFDALCKGAGEKIVRTVDDVEGILLMNVREEQTSESRGDPNWPDAGLSQEHSGEGYLYTFLLWENHDDKRSPRGYVTNMISELPGYAFVDVPEENGTVFRYRLIKGEAKEQGWTGRFFVDTKLSREIVEGKPARYAVSFINYSDPEDRKKWIAGTKVTVTDTLNNEVLAEKTWYSVEPGQGSREGFRQPWGFARSCPINHDRGSSTRFFVDQILKPKKAE